MKKTLSVTKGILIFFLLLPLIACAAKDIMTAILDAQERVKQRTNAEIVEATIFNGDDLRFKIINTPLLNLSPEEQRDSALVIARYAKEILNAKYENFTEGYKNINILIYKGGRYGQKDGFGITIAKGEKFVFPLKDL